MVGYIPSAAKTQGGGPGQLRADIQRRVDDIFGPSEPSAGGAGAPGIGPAEGALALGMNANAEEEVCAPSWTLARRDATPPRHRHDSPLPACLSVRHGPLPVSLSACCKGSLPLPPLPPWLGAREERARARLLTFGL